MKKAIAILLLCFLFISPKTYANNKFDMKIEAEGIFISNASLKITQNIFNNYGYKDYIYMPDWKYPPLFFENLPQDFGDLKDKSLRNRLFIQILAPLALYVNEKIILERYPLLSIKEHLEEKKDLTEEEKQKLEEMAKKYDIFTRMQDQERYEIILNELLIRVDEIPPSFLIAIAAAESNWGTAREVKLGNSLYKWKIWHTEEGIKPLEDKDDSYRIKIYPSLLAAMEEYALKLNSDINFKSFRELRQHRRNHNSPLRGNAMVYNMVLGSPLQNYAGLISYIITFYDLVNIDEASLGSINQFLKEKK